MGFLDWFKSGTSSGVASSDYDKLDENYDKYIESSDEESEQELSKKILESVREEEERQKKKIEAERQLKLQALMEEFYNDKDGIILAIKKELNDKNPIGALDYVDKYRAVAENDEEFMFLADEARKLRKQHENLSLLKTKLEYTAKNDYKTRSELLRGILDIEPSDEYKLELCKCEYETAPNDNYKLRIQWLKPLIDLLSKTKDQCGLSEYKQALKECKNELKKQQKIEQKKLRSQTQSLSVVGDTSSSGPDLRIGYHVGGSILKGQCVSSGNSNLFTSGDDVYVLCHSHGISIDSRCGFSYPIHYSQIISMDANETKNEGCGIFSGIAGAALGFALGGVFGALAGGAAGGLLGGNSSKDYVRIMFREASSNEISEFSIIVEGENANERILQFIRQYYYEIELTKQTGRSPQRELQKSRESNKIIQKIIVISVCMCVVALLIVFYIVVLDRKHEQTVSKEIATDQNTVIPSETKSAPIEAPDPFEDKWVSSASQCYNRNAKTILTVSGTKPADTTIELSGVSVNSCKTLSVTFDKQPEKTVKCSIVDGNIRIASDQRMIKNMRAAAKMMVVVPLDNGEERIIFYSLNGFSKACPWTKSPSSKDGASKPKKDDKDGKAKNTDDDQPEVKDDDGILKKGGSLKGETPGR